MSLDAEDIIIITIIVNLIIIIIGIIGIMIKYSLEQELELFALMRKCLPVLKLPFVLVLPVIVMMI